MGSGGGEAAVDGKTVFQSGLGGSVRPGVRLNGTYEIDRLIAEGGMGEVYKGFNIQTGDPVAIKMIRPELSGNADALALFRREASTLHDIHHDAIVRYFVFSVDPDLQRAYLAMEFVDGPSLGAHLRSGPLPLGEANLLRTRLASALDAAHRLGVIHRDISSDNFILPGGDVRKAKIIDFGIARSHRPGEETIIGDGFAGKYNYVSPEQLGLFGGEVTARSDIYSFGLVLAEALLGRRIDMSGSQIEIIEKRRKVPDLSGIPSSVRPLLESMLQPNPADRPADMAFVAAWYGGPKLEPPSNRATAASRTPSGGSLAAGLGAFIVLASLGGTAYVFRGDLQNALAPLIGSPGPDKSTSSTSTKPTAIPTPEPTPAASASPEPTPAATPTPEPTTAASATPEPTATNSGVPSAADIKDDLPPRAPQSLVELPSATVGSPYRADISGFTDPGGKGLQLTADPAPPEGLTFEDHGDGTAEISGTPSKAGAVTFEVVAVNHKGKAARITTRIAVADKTAKPVPKPSPTASPVRPPRATQASVALESATVGSDYTADLPPFSPGANSSGLTLRAEGELPEGLNFVDENGGLSQLSGKPAHAGSYDFHIVATDALGQSARMAVALVVAPAPVVASRVPDNPEAFVRAYDDGPCFLVRPSAASGAAAGTLEAIGADRTAFSRFESAYERAVGAAPVANFKAILPAQCPGLQLLKTSPAASPAAAAEPRLELAHFEIGGPQPLAGTVTGIAGRRLALIVIGEDGAVHRIPGKGTPGADIAAFSVPLGQADAASIGPLQLLVAIASDKPLAALEAFKAGTIGELAPKLIAEWERAGAAAQMEFFKLK